MYGITGAFRRFCFDQAIVTFGVALENEMDSVRESKDPKMTAAKKERVMDKWLGRPQKFRNPTGATTSSPTAGNTDSEPSGESNG